MTIDSIIRQRSINYPFYGCHSPSPLGAVEISVEDKIFGDIANISQEDRVIIQRRLAKYDQAISELLSLIRKNGPSDFAYTELAFNYYLKGVDGLAREALGLVKNTDSLIIKYLMSCITGASDADACSCLTALVNPLLFLRASVTGRSVKTQIIDDEFLELAEEKKIAVFMVLIQSGTINLCLNKDIVARHIFLYRNFILNNHKIIEHLINIYGLEFVRHQLSKNGKLLFTPDTAFSLLTHEDGFDCLFDESLIVHGEGFLHYGRSEIMSLLFMCPDMIRDRNTSDNGTRFYSINLGHLDEFGTVKQAAAQHLSQYSTQIRNRIRLLDPEIRISEKFDIWFDMSVTYGESRIAQHIHTARAGDTYFGTLVWYANVPENLGAGDGALEVYYDRQGTCKKLRPKTNDFIMFPPWFSHGTTPTNTEEPRVTFNFDIWHRAPEVTLG